MGNLLKKRLGYCKSVGMPLKKFCLLYLFFSCMTLSALNENFELVWVTSSSENYFEKDWIKELLDGLAYIERDSTDLACLAFPSLLVITQPLTGEQIRCLKEHKKNGGKIGVFHLSDEGYTASCSWYSQVEFVFRQYYHEKYAKLPNVQFIPLGCKKGFRTNLKAHEVKDFSDRRYLWSFMGQVSKSNRITMMKCLKKLQGLSYSHYNKGFNTGDCLRVLDYQDILLESKFSPCPLGFVNPDTFRLYESLESGCIPIVEDPAGNYFTSLYKHPPFLILKRWQDLSNLLKHYLSDENVAEEKRLECFHWWQEEKERVRKRIKYQINLKFSDMKQ